MVISVSRVYFENPTSEILELYRRINSSRDFKVQVRTEQLRWSIISLVFIDDRQDYKGAIDKTKRLIDIPMIPSLRVQMNLIKDRAHKLIKSSIKKKQKFN